MATMRSFAGPMAYSRSPDPWGVGGRGGGGTFGAVPTATDAPRSDQPGGGGAFWDGIEGRRRGSYNAGFAGSDGPAPGWATDTIRNRWTDALNRTGSQAEMAEDAFYNRAAGFDARDYLDETPFDATGYMRNAAQGAFAEFLPQLERSIGDLRGSQVGMGRLNTGFATEDEDRLVEGGLQNLNDELARMALQAGGLQLSHNQGVAGRRLQAAGLNQESTRMLGNYGMQQGGRYLDLMSGQYDRKVAEQNAKKGGFGDWLKAGAQIAATFI